MSTDKRKTLAEQMYGMDKAVNAQNLDGKLGIKNRTKCPSADHENLRIGQTCAACGFQPKNKI